MLGHLAWIVWVCSIRWAVLFIIVAVRVFFTHFWNCFEASAKSTEVHLCVGRNYWLSKRIRLFFVAEHPSALFMVFLQAKVKPTKILIGMIWVFLSVLIPFDRTRVVFVLKIIFLIAFFLFFDVLFTILLIRLLGVSEACVIHISSVSVRYFIGNKRFYVFFVFLWV